MERLRCVSTMCAAGVAVVLVCQRGLGAENRRTSTHDERDAVSAFQPERPDDEPGIPALPSTSGGMRGVYGLGPFVSVQVNVSASGTNVLGDAGNEPSIAVDPTAPNRMAIGWRQFDTVASNFRQAGVGYSNDGGRTWTFPGVLDPGLFRSDPVLDFDAAGNFYYNSLSVVGQDFTAQVFKSVDGGVSWLAPVPAFGGDKVWMAVDRTGGTGAGHIYAKWQTFFGCCGDATFTRSTDGGQSFMTPVAVPLGPTFGTVAVGPSGDVYAVGIEALAFQDFDTIVFARSSNARDPMQTPSFDVSTVVDLGGSMRFSTGPNPAGLLGQTWVAANHAPGPAHGDIYMLGSVDPPGPDPLDVMFVRSVDGGLSWSSPVRVNDDVAGNGAWQWFGTLSVAPNGRIDAIWNDTRNDPTATFSELFHASSSDGGVTWSANVPVTVPFNHFLGYPQQDKLGDYYEMISDNVGAHVAFAATFNGEQDVYYLRIGDYDCNGNGVPDTDDLAAGTSEDCNANGIPDTCEIAAGAVSDGNGNGIPDGCETGAIPTASEWAVAVLMLALLTGGTIVFRIRRVAVS